MGDVCKLVINVTFIFLWARTETWWPVVHSSHCQSDVQFHPLLSSHWSCLSLPFSCGSFSQQLFLFQLEVLNFLTPFWMVQTSLLSLAGLCNPVLSTCGNSWLHIFPPIIWRFVTAKKEKVIEMITLASSRLNYRDLCSRTRFTIISWNMLSLSPFGSKKTQEHSHCFSSHFSITIKAAHPYA